MNICLDENCVSQMDKKGTKTTQLYKWWNSSWKMLVENSPWSTCTLSFLGRDWETERSKGIKKIKNKAGKSYQAEIREKFMQKFKKWHTDCCSGSLEDKLLFMQCLFSNVHCLKLFNLHNFVPTHSKKWPGLQQIPEGNVKRNGRLKHLDNQDSFHSKQQMCQGTRPFFR